MVTQTAFLWSGAKFVVFSCGFHNDCCVGADGLRVAVGASVLGMLGAEEESAVVVSGCFSGASEEDNTGSVVVSDNAGGDEEALDLRRLIAGRFEDGDDPCSSDDPDCGGTSTLLNARTGSGAAPRLNPQLSRPPGTSMSSSGCDDGTDVSVGEYAYWVVLR